MSMECEKCGLDLAHYDDFYCPGCDVDPPKRISELTAQRDQLQEEVERLENVAAERLALWQNAMQREGELRAEVKRLGGEMNATAQRSHKRKVALIRLAKKFARYEAMNDTGQARKAEACERKMWEAKGEVTALAAKVNRLHDCLAFETQAHVGERDRLRAALQRFGLHDDGFLRGATACPWESDGDHCSCGLAAALAGSP